MVATDGGCADTFGGRAGWGIAYGTEGDIRVSGALPGPWQTAQRAEVYAVLVAVTLLTGPITLVTDSRYVHDRIELFPKGHRPQGAHEDLWSIVFEKRHSIASVMWGKAHLTLEEAQARGIPADLWGLNARADEGATLGIEAHIEDPGYWALYRFRCQRIISWQSHLLSIYRMRRRCKACKAPAPPRASR